MLTSCISNPGAMLYQGNGGKGTLTSTYTGGFLEHPATGSQKHQIHSQVDTQRKQISSMGPGTPGFSSTPQAVYTWCSECGL